VWAQELRLNEKVKTTEEGSISVKFKSPEGMGFIIATLLGGSITSNSNSESFNFLESQAFSRIFKSEIMTKKVIYDHYHIVNYNT
jgi:hypothetical protein